MANNKDVSIKDDHIIEGARSKSKPGGDYVDAKGEFGSQADSTDANGSSSITPTVKKSVFNSTEYKMDHRNRGKAVIINNFSFDTRTGMKEIPHKNKDDEDAMYGLLNFLGFEEIKVERNLNADKMRSVLIEVAGEYTDTNSDCFVCVVLSRGEEGYIYAANDKIPLDELVQPFKGNACANLVGKPKLFFFQAYKVQRGVTKADTPDVEQSEVTVFRRIPTEADILMVYSLIPDTKETQKERGEWFFKTFIEVCKSNKSSMDLLTMLTRTNKKVSQYFEEKHKTAYEGGKNQIPCVTSLLTKDLYFK